MKKLYFATIALLILFGGCKKSDKKEQFSDNANTEVIVTSQGTFDITIQQTLYATNQIFTEESVQSISNCDQRFHLSDHDQIDVEIRNATAPIHVVVTHNAITFKDETSSNPGYSYHAGF